MVDSSNPKIVQILRTAKDLFWKFGFKRVTIEEICKEAGVSKMTFYKYFANKTELVKTLMSGTLEEALVEYDQIMNQDITYAEKVLEMIDLKKKQVETMSSEFFRDYLDSGDPEFIAYLTKISNENTRRFADDFRKAQEKGEIRKDVKVEFIHLMMNHMIELTNHQELINLYDNPQDLVMEITNFLFYGILDRNIKR